MSNLNKNYINKKRNLFNNYKFKIDNLVINQMNLIKINMNFNRKMK